MRVTLLEDDAAQAEMLKSWLAEAGHDVEHFQRGESFVAALPQTRFDLIILDWEMPGLSGLDVLERVRSEVRWHVPVLFFTQRDTEADIVRALNAGADDYMVKGPSQREFLARVTALGRRLGGQERELVIGPYRFLPESRQATVNGEPADLTAKDFDLAYYLFRNVGRLLSRDQLLRDVWKVGGVHTRTVDVHISRVRKRLKITPDSGFRIKTIYQHGYRLESL